MNKCANCRFCKNNQCVKFNIVVDEDYKACNDYAEKQEINESRVRIQLND